MNGYGGGKSMKKKALSLTLMLALIVTVMPIGILGADTNAPDIKTIKKESKEALKKTLASLKNTKKSAYLDLTGDGVKDLFVKGTIYSYNYKDKNVRKIILSADETNPIKKINKLYVSKKKKRIFVTTSDKKSKGRDEYSYYLKGCLFKMKEINDAFERDDGAYYIARDFYYVGLMKKPKVFVPKNKYKKGKKYYILNYSWNDQDDAWYNWYTSKKIKKKIKKILPGKKRIKLKNKITI